MERNRYKTKTNVLHSLQYVIPSFLTVLLFTPGAHLTPIDPSCSDQFHVVTVSDTGRNWSDQEVRALIQVWSDARVCRQLESSTRKRDIFVQISNRLMQQGIERDWKQCHTKYKNLKYLYRSLQRGKTDEADPRRLMRFYDEVDAIMNHTTNGSPADHQADSGELTMLEDFEENHNVDVHLTKAHTETMMVGAMEERTCSSDSVSSISTPNNEEPKLHTGNGHRLDQQHRLMSEPNIIICLYLVFDENTSHIAFYYLLPKSFKDTNRTNSQKNSRFILSLYILSPYRFTISQISSE